MATKIRLSNITQPLDQDLSVPGLSSSGDVDITSTTGTTVYNNGALVVAGGLGVGQNLYVKEVIAVEGPDSSVIKIKSTSGNGSAELDMLSNGTGHAYVDYGPNRLVFRSSDDGGIISTSNVLVLNNAGEIGVGASPISGTKFRVTDSNDPDSATSMVYLSSDNPKTNGQILHIRDDYASASQDSFGGVKFASAPGYDWTVGKRTTNNSGWFAIQDQNSDERLTIDGNGYLGLSQTQPDVKLHIFGNDFPSSQLKLQREGSSAYTGTVNFSKIKHDANGAIIATQSGDRIAQIYTEASTGDANTAFVWGPNITIDATANVDLSTASHVRGNINFRHGDNSVVAHITDTGDMDVTGNLTVGGDLTISGNTTYVNTNDLSIEDLNITLAAGSANSTVANGAGITIDGASATLTYNSTYDDWVINRPLRVESSDAYAVVLQQSGTNQISRIRSDSNEFSIEIDEDNSFSNSLFTLNLDGSERLRIWGDDGHGAVQQTGEPNGTFKLGATRGTYPSYPDRHVHILDDVGSSYWSTTLTKQQAALRLETIYDGGGYGTRAVGAYGGGIVFNHLGGHSTTHWDNSHAWLGLRVVSTPGHETSALVFATNHVTDGDDVDENGFGNHDRGLAEKMVIMPDQYSKVGIGASSLSTLKPGGYVQGSRGEISIDTDDVVMSAIADSTFNEGIFEIQDTANTYANTTANTNIGGMVWTHANGQGDVHRQIAAIKTYRHGINNLLDGGDLRFYTKRYGDDYGYDDPKFVIDHQGHVGIGVTDPATHLHVEADVHGVWEALRLKNLHGDGASQGAVDINLDVMASTGQVARATIRGRESTPDAPYSELAFFTSGSTSLSPTERLKIDKDGNITSDTPVAAEGNQVHFYKIPGNPGTSTSRIVLLQRINVGANEGRITNGIIRGSRSTISSATRTASYEVMISCNGDTGGINQAQLRTFGVVPAGVAKLVTCTYANASWIGIEFSGSSSHYYPSFYTFEGVTSDNELQTIAYSSATNVTDFTNTYGTFTVQNTDGFAINVDNTNKTFHVNHTAGTMAALIDRDVGSNAANLNEFSSFYSLSLKNRTGGSFLNFGGNGTRTDIQATDGQTTAVAKKIALNPFGGNVGIGTIDPQTKFEVATSDNVNSYNDGAIQVISSTPIAFVSPSNLNPSLNRWGIKLREDNEGDFSIHDNRQAATRLKINDNGYVGIGNQIPGSEPDAVFNVRSSLNETVAHFENNDGSPGNYPVVHIERTHNLTQPDSPLYAALFIEDHSTNHMITCRTKAGTNVFVVDGDGNMSAASKSFDIEHPTKEGMRLHHGSLEGPEHGVYVRGRLKDSNVIVLPDYWTGLVHEDTITVQLTAIGGKQDLWVEDIIDNTIIVGCEAPVNCFYFVQAERKDVDRFDVEYSEEK